MKINIEWEQFLEKNVDLETLGNMILSLNASSSRKTSTPLSFSVYTNTPECVSVDFCSNRRSVSCSIPTDRYNKNRQPILHNHDYYELMYIQKGTMQIQIEGTVYSYHQGDVCLFNQKIHHAEIQQENSVIHYCCITDMFLEKYPGDICFYPENNRSFSRFFSEIRTETGSCSNFLEFRLRRTEDSAPDTPNLVHYILTKMKQELQKQDPGAWLVIYGFFCRLLHTLSDPALYDCRFIALNSQVKAKAAHAVSRAVNARASSNARKRPGFSRNKSLICKIFPFFQIDHLIKSLPLFGR